ncbi:hypothetical protein ABZV34_30230 [Streptomyces sp. NPDC005195]|uniref:hypothetical protein n=1 Tax=Streptomyces sp. NPDC005195 TaxID=3154561 RepID=UPI0033B64A18
MSELGTVALEVKHDGSCQATAFSPDGKRFASGGSDTLLRVRPTGIGTRRDMTVGGAVTGIAFSPEPGVP